MNDNISNFGSRKRVLQQAIKQRVMKLACPPSAHHSAKLSEYLMNQCGVQSVAVNGSKVTIRYDLLKITELRIEQAIMSTGAKLNQNGFERMRRAWVHYTEEIEIENRKTVPSACCNRPPPGV